MFGTMSKPLHAGKAAQNGLLAAELARRGFTSHPAAIEAELGFAWTQAPHFEPQQAFVFPTGEHTVDNVQFKRYASCAGTHSAIDGARKLCEEHGVSADDIQRLTIELPELLFGVCNIHRPETALEAKFSVRFTTAVALLEGDLSEQGFTDEFAHDPKVAALCERIYVEPRTNRPAEDVSTTPLTAYLRDGRQVRVCVAASQPTSDADLGEQWILLESKCRGLATPVIGGENTGILIEKLSRLEELTSIGNVIVLLGAPA
jgi:2-methylcitrate dehydratase PrpD